MSIAFGETLVLLDHARTLLREGKYPAVVTLLTPLPQEELVAEPELACMLASSWRSSGETARGLALLAKVEASWGARGNDFVYRFFLATKGVLHFEQGELDAAVAAWSMFLEAATDVEHHKQIGHAYNNLGIVATIRYHHSDALAFYSRAHIASERAGDHIMVAATYNNLGIAYRELGMLDDAFRASDAAIALMYQNPHETGLAILEAARAQHHIVQGDTAMAGAMLHRAMNRHTRSGAQEMNYTLEHVRGNLLIAQARHAEAVKVLSEAAAHTRSDNPSYMEAYLLSDLCIALARAGDAEGAHLVMSRALTLYEDMGAPLRADLLIRTFSLENDGT